MLNKIKSFFHKPSNLELYAQRELKLAGWYDSDAPYGDMMPKAVMQLFKLFKKQEHSGLSASIALGIFHKLASFQPLSPLTGEEDEWITVDDNGLKQNKRYSSVFLNAEGKAYDIDGKIFVNEDGSKYTSKDSVVYINFPYTPNTEYVHISNPVK
jgi:hypothetical protein